MDLLHMFQSGTIGTVAGTRNAVLCRLTRSRSRKSVAGFSSDSSPRQIRETTIRSLLAHGKAGSSMLEVPLTERHLRTPREAISQIESFDSWFSSRKVDNNLNFTNTAILRPIYLPHHLSSRLGIETRQEAVNIRKLDHQGRTSTLYANLVCPCP